MSLHEWVMAGVFALANAVGVIAIYAITRAIWGGKQTDETQTLAGSVLLRVATLHGLILALVFAQELSDYSDIRADLVREATAIADIFNDIRRYETPQMQEVQTMLADYLRHAISTEWDSLSQTGKLTAQGWGLREQVYQTVLNLDPETPRQTDLRAHMVAKSQLIAELRQSRENSAVRTLSGLFWFAAIIGLVWVAVPYLTYSPTPLHLSLLSLYGAYSGVILYVIYAFSDPFAQPGALPPTAFIQLLAGEMGHY
ncbi:hypothetical protein LGQ03_08640 [Loktanella sp. TSTF-M6]|uniref:DUF4239 domain-containing protein n=1 Tax=Loktanella gaetbuli TaxID=2881335 RepID=A0ABS8BUB9_9RHOB|nr:hypothetical protein [Loktanella gaetbuli]MCB5199307.1 hypothetical protein [Loktanella gaetbuli]